MPDNFAIALLHYPVYNKHKQLVTTAVTNLDIHDIARTARTFGVSRYYIVTPSDEQQSLVNRIVTHWGDGWGAGYNPDRREALSIVRCSKSLQDAVDDLGDGKPVNLIATGAAKRPGSISFEKLRSLINDHEQRYLLLLGTGWGLAEQLFEQARYIVEPIDVNSDYNHLPVRSALAIMLDRLFGRH